MKKLTDTKFKFNLQYFAEDESAMSTLDTLLQGMDQPQEDQTEQPAPEESQPEEQPEEEQPEQEKPQPQPKQKPSQAEKMNYAFGQMRQENGLLKATLAKLAQANGIEFKDDKELLTKLSDDALEKLSARQNIPVETLRRLEQLERRDAEYAEQQRKSATLVGFQKLMTDYELTNDQVMDFARELDERGLNPFLQDVNIEEQYKLVHFNDIVQAQVTKAVQDALKKTSVADEHSTTPSTKRGVPVNTGDDKKISTVSALDDMLRDVKL